MSENPSRLPESGSPFERKVRLSTYALFLERLWPRLWLIVGIAGVFVLASMAGLWSEIGPLAHKLVLAGFVAALLGGLMFAARVRWPDREQAVRRIELRSGLPHRPATSYEDTLSLNHEDPSTQAIWQAHKSRLADLVRRLRVGRPTPRTDRLDPFAMRALLLLGMVTLIGLVGDSARDRLMAAFRFGPPLTAAEARLDAWVTPPAYTAKPPILLADGQRGGLLMAGADGKPLDVPENSVVIARTSGIGAAKLEIELKPDNGPVVRQAATPPPEAAAGKPASSGTSGEASEVRLQLKRSGVVRVLGGGSELARWTFNVTPDQPPRITMTKTPELSRRGSMKSFYKVEDDYGIASAEARFQLIKPDAGDPRTAWAREGMALKGRRLPYERPPTLNLRLPRLNAQIGQIGQIGQSAKNAKDAETNSFHELASHPWSGMRGRLTLVAKDHAGNVGRSQTIEMTVPERRFVRPLARAVIEQRRLLLADSRNTRRVLHGLEALTYEPAAFIQDRNVYLSLRSAYHRLLRDKTRAGLKSVQEQLWHIALRIEDGRSLSDKEQRLRDLQDQLSRALQDGASDQEMQRLMQELRQALNEYLQELAQQGQDAPQDQARTRTRTRR